MKIENSGTVPAVTNKAPCFTQLNRDCHWLILGHVALTKLKCIPIVIHFAFTAMYPARAGIHYSTWSKHVGKWRDRRGEKHCQLSFSWMNTATQTRNLKLIKRERFLKLSQTEFPEEKQQLLEEKDADNTRKIKSFIQWFWELIRLGRSIFIPIPPYGPYGWVPSADR